MPFLGAQRRAQLDDALDQVIHSPVAGLKQGRKPVTVLSAWDSSPPGWQAEGAAGCGAAADRGRVNGQGVPGRVRYQARVAAMASASGVPAAPNAAWYLLVSRTKGSSNW